MKDILLKFLQKYDKTLKSENVMQYNSYENKEEIYLDCGGKNIDFLISNLSSEFEFNKPISNLEDGFCVYSFYIPNDFEIFPDMFTVDTEVNITTRNRKNVYRTYLNSKEWYDRKVIALKYAEYKCSRCGETENLEVHHLNYETVGNENISDLFVCCKDCHSKFHNLTRVDG